MVGHGGNSAGSYIADPTSPIPPHCASVVVTSTARVKADVTSFINRAVIRGFFTDAYFSRSAAHRLTFLTLNQVVKSASGRLKAAVGRLFGHRSISSGNDQIFGRCPADAPPTIVRRPTGDRLGSCRSPADDNESCDDRQVTVRSACGHRRVLSELNLEI